MVGLYVSNRRIRCQYSSDGDGATVEVFSYPGNSKFINDMATNIYVNFADIMTTDIIGGGCGTVDHRQCRNTPRGDVGTVICGAMSRGSASDGRGEGCK